MTPVLRVQADRPSVRPGGGTRYLVLSVKGAERPAVVDAAVVVDWSRSLRSSRELVEAVVHELATQVAPVALLAFADAVRPLAGVEDLATLPFGRGSALHEAWLRGCHAVAPERAGARSGHCILVTDGRATVGEKRVKLLADQAADVWEHASVATSVLAVGPRPHQTLLRAMAWHGGGSYRRARTGSPAGVAVPAPRCLLEIAAPGAEVDILSRTRGLSRGEGSLRVVVDGARPVVAAVTFRGSRSPELRVRLGGAGDWQTVRFEVGKSTGPKHPGVMRRVVSALARRRTRLARPEPPAAGSATTAEGAADLIGRFVPASSSWPSPLPAEISPRRLQDLCRGCLLWGAVGSALGRALVGLEPATIRSRYGAGGLQHYEPWLPGVPDSRGMVSGDVQILQEVALTLIEGRGSFDPEAFASRLTALLADSRGLGNACEAAGAALKRGQPWWKAGSMANSAGNGAALRVAPVGLCWALSPQATFLHREAVVSAVVTHTHPVGVAAAVVMAQAVAWCVRERLASDKAVDAKALLAFLADAIQDLEPEPTPERRLGGHRTTLSQRLREVEALLPLSPEEALLVTWNGAFALESVPAALYCFLKYSHDPRQAVLTAVNGGFDADSVGCMTGQLAGAWWGAQSLKRTVPAWWAGLEGRDGLLALADPIAELARRKAARGP